MPPKKRAFPEEEHDDSSAPVRLSKRRRQGADLSDILNGFVDSLKEYKSEADDRFCLDAFMKLPKKRSAPDYFELVKNPIDFSRIQLKVRNNEYPSIDAFMADFRLLVENAKLYYNRGSLESRDATELWNYLEELRDEAENAECVGLSSEATENSGAGDDSFDSDPVGDQMAELFSAVVHATDEGRELADAFKILPSKKDYPDYYEVIKEPIDLKTIAQNIQEGSYSTLHELEKDLALMCRNAKTYNEPGSEIYKDATMLFRVIKHKRFEVENRRVIPFKRGRRNAIKAAHAVVEEVANAEDTDIEDEDVEDEEEEEEEEVGEEEIEEEIELEEEDPADAGATKSNQIQMPKRRGRRPKRRPVATSESGDSQHVNYVDRVILWDLILSLRMWQAGTGHQLISDQFMRIPSKKTLPDYHQEIRKPMSFRKVVTNLIKGKYRQVKEVINDLDLIFKNARSYNRPDSKIFLDATGLRKDLHARVKEIQDTLPNFLALHVPGSAYNDQEKFEQIIKGCRKSRTERIEHPLKARCTALYKTLLNYEEDGRVLIEPFVKKPDPQEYPDYYEVIDNPMDMQTIYERIRQMRYSTQEECVEDFRLMLENCRTYNEEDSQIYQDANSLEEVLQEKLEELGSYVAVSDPIFMPSKRPSKKAPCPKLQALFEKVANYVDNKGRNISKIFNKLPSKIDYPEYYDVIREPIDLDTVKQKLYRGSYESLDEMLPDLLLMFENACTYNEPDSQLYKDALLLRKVALQSKLELGAADNEDGVPDVKGVVLELLNNIFTETYNHQMEKTGRSFTDSMVEFSETPEFAAAAEDEGAKVLNLDLIKRAMDRGYYRRLDIFQQDMFTFFRRVRKASKIDSIVWNDSITLQKFFIRYRDELCKKRFDSPALSYTEADLLDEIEKTKAEKVLLDTTDSDVLRDISKSSSGGNEVSEMNINGLTVRPGDYVYVQPREKGMQPHVTMIERLYTDEKGVQWLFGTWFYRPHETFHLASRKFLTREVFKSDSHTNTLLNEVMGKCHVMFVRDFFSLRPEGFEDTDVFVCESRYFPKMKRFQKIKVWPPTTDDVKYVPRERPLEAIRVPSIFRKKESAEEISRRLTHDKSLSASDREDDKELIMPALPQQDEYRPCDRVMPDVMLPTPSGDDKDNTYYEQITFSGGTYRTGDCVYVRTETTNLMARIEKMWTDKQGVGFFHGPWFVTPQEIHASGAAPGRLYFRQEVFLSSIEDTNPLLAITGRCHVMNFQDYMKVRPTELDEDDVYVCESTYNESEKIIGALENGLMRHITRSDAVQVDELLTLPRSPRMTRESFPFGPRRLHQPTQPSLPAAAVAHAGGRRNSSSSAAGSLNGAASHLHSDRVAHESHVNGSYAKNSSRDTRSTFVGIGGGAGPNLKLSALGSAGTSSVSSKPQGTHHHHRHHQQHPTVISMSDNDEESNEVASTSTRDETSNQSLPSSLSAGTATLNMSGGQAIGGSFGVNPNSASSFGGVSGTISGGGGQHFGSQTPVGSSGQSSQQSLSSSKHKSTTKVAKLQRISGYILYSTERRKTITQENPDCSFGELSRLLGSEWKELPAGTKALYEDRANKQNELNKIKHAEMFGTNNSVAYTERSNDLMKVYECHWDNCDYQFEEVEDLTQHVALDPSGHVCQTFIQLRETVNFQCRWLMCGRVRKNQPPFNTIGKLLKHVKDVHVKTSQRTILPEQKTRNFCPRRSRTLTAPHQLNPTPPHTTQLPVSSGPTGAHAMLPAHHAQMAAHPPLLHPSQTPSTGLALSGSPGSTPRYVGVPISAGGGSGGCVNTAAMAPMPPGVVSAALASGGLARHSHPPEPLFVAPPPKPHRLLHTYAYIKYIEGLNQTDQKTISNWDRQLQATRDNTVLPSSQQHGGTAGLGAHQQLPFHWLANGPGKHGSAINALWALRDFMLRDALNIHQIV